MRMVGLRCEIKLASWRKLDGLPQPNQLGGIRLGLFEPNPNFEFSRLYEAAG
jgi:hypothetical protein